MQFGVSFAFKGYPFKNIFDVICLCKDSNMFLFITCHDVHKQMPSFKNHRILRGSRMTKSQTKLSNLQTVTSILLVTSHNTKDRYCETCYDNKEKRLMRYAFLKTAIYLSVPHAMTFTNKCHLYKITELFVEHGCQNHRLSCKYTDCYPHITCH